MKKFFTLLLAYFFGKTSSRITIYIRIMQKSRKLNLDLVAIIYSRIIEKYGVFISSKALLGAGLRLPHPTSIVIGEGVSIGKNVTIYQSVTLGGRVVGDWKKGNYPTIGDGTVIFAGAVIVGKVKIGKNCVVGANSVVVCDLPDNSVAVGAPARVVKIIDTMESV